MRVVRDSLQYLRLRPLTGSHTSTTEAATPLKKKNLVKPWGFIHSARRSPEALLWCHRRERLKGTDLGGSDGSNEDVLIKTVRVLANLCLTESAGRGLAAAHSERVMKALLACLDLAERSQQQMDMSPEASAAAHERREELATAALATLNNITFYREPDPPDPLHDTLDRICAATCRWLKRGGAPACEAARALGNLTREPRAAQLFLLEGALDALDTFFDHDEESVRCAAAGVLVNVCGAGAGARGAEAGGAAARALAAACARGDAPAAALLARALWNAHAHAPLLAARAHSAARALAAFIDDDSVFRACEASRNGHRRASDPSILKHQVTFEPEMGHRVGRTLSVDQDLHLEHISEDEALSGEDLGFEEGDLGGESCDCEPCVRLAAWEELVGVAIPLLEKLRPVKADASVGTD